MRGKIGGGDRGRRHGMDIHRSPRHRLVQVFLGRNVQEPATYEVYVDIESEDAALTCTCPGFTSLRRCKHADHVKSCKPDVGLTSVPLQYDKELDMEGFNEILGDPEAFRNWVLRNGVVGVL